MLQHCAIPKSPDHLDNMGIVRLIIVILINLGFYVDIKLNMVSLVISLSLNEFCLKPLFSQIPSPKPLQDDELLSVVSDN